MRAVIVIELDVSENSADLADSLATQPADRCPTCGPGYHYGDDGCRHKPAPEAAPVEGAHWGHSGPEMAPEPVDPDDDGRAL